MTKRSFRNQLLSVNICARLLGKIRSIPVSIGILSAESLTLESILRGGPPYSDNSTVDEYSVRTPTTITTVEHLSDPFLDDPLKQARIDEAIADVKNMKFMYFAYVKIFGRPESAEGLKEAEDSFQALSDLRFKVRMILSFDQNLQLILEWKYLFGGRQSNAC